MARAPAAERLAPLLLVAAVGLAWANAFRGEFQFDDWNVIVDDPRVTSLGAWWRAMPGIRPLLKLSWALNHESGLGLAGFHAVNLAIHAANALLVHGVLRRRFAWPAGLAGALVFALHPVQTEAVTYVSGRSTSLAAFLSLASLAAWSAGLARGRPWLVHGLSPALFAGALAVKEFAAVLPLALLLAAATDPRLSWDARRATRGVVAHVAVLAGAAALALASPGYRMLLATSLGARDLADQLRTQIGGLGWLVGQLVRLDRLNADPALPVRTAWSAGLALGALALVTAVDFALASFRRRPALAFGVLWFFLWLAPTNSLLPRLDVANDRQLYLPLAGVAALVAALAERRPPRRVAVGVLAIALALAAATHARNRVYASETAFWRDVAAKSPHNGRAWNNLGWALSLEDRDAEAAVAFSRALALDPADVRAAVNRRLLREGALRPPQPPRSDERQLRGQTP